MAFGTAPDLPLAWVPDLQVFAGASPTPPRFNFM
jgi:hypothetical protein